MNVLINAQMGLREWLLLLALSFVWGGSFFFVETLTDDFAPMTIVVLRVGLAAVPLWILIALTNRKVPVCPSIWLAFLCMGTINNVIPFSLLVWAQTAIASGVASILNATTPMFTVIVAGVLLSDEKVTAKKVAGVLAGIAGVAVMIGPQALLGDGNDLWAQIAVLGAALSYAFAAVFGRRFKRFGVDPVVVAAGQVTAATAVLAPIAIVVERPFDAPMPGPEAWAAVGGLAVLSTSLAYIIYFRLLETAGATNLMLVTLLVPVFAILLGVVFLAETLGHFQIAGMALIAFGLLLIDGRLFARRRTPAPDRIVRR